MFTGIVQAVGRIASATPQGDGLRLAVATDLHARGEVALGDSVAVSGCCLTVVAIEPGALQFDVSAETLRCTTGLDRAGPVNLELALRLSDRLGGHLMTGHVDGVGTVVAIAPVQDDAWGSVRLDVDVPAPLARFVAQKGSVAVAGVSLTVNAIDGPRFSVNLIPHTLSATTLGELVPGAPVNIEIDLVARYVARLHEAGAA